MPRAGLAILIAAGVLLGWASARADVRDPADVPAGVYALDPARASLSARLSYIGGLARSTLRFSRLSGRFAYDPQNWRSTRVTISVDPKSVVGGERGGPNAWFARYFEPEKYPTIRFNSTALSRVAGGRAQLAGDLTLHGVTRPVTLDIVFHGLEAEDRIGFSGRGRIRRSEFGITAARPLASDIVELAFDVEFVRR